MVTSGAGRDIKLQFKATGIVGADGERLGSDARIIESQRNNAAGAKPAASNGNPTPHLPRSRDKTDAGQNLEVGTCDIAAVTS